MRAMTYISKLRNCDTIYRENELKNEEIRGFQHMCLSIICKDKGQSQEMLAKSMMVNKSTITRWLTTLEQKGYIYRKTDEKNKRITRVYPTEKTIEMQPKINEIFASWDDYLMEDFNDSEKKTFLAMLDKMLKKAMEKVNLE